MNALQQLIRGYLDDHPGEGYSSIARRASEALGRDKEHEVPRQTIASVAGRRFPKKLPDAATLEILALGMHLPLGVVQEAAVLSLGHVPMSEMVDDDSQAIIVSWRAMTKAGRADLERRARYIIAEEEERAQARAARRKPKNP